MSIVGAVRQRTAKVFYGWWIVLGAFVMQTLTSGLSNRAFGFYLPRFVEEFGWSRALISLAFSLSQLESSVLGPIQGWLIDRIGPRNVIRIGVGLFAAGLVLLSQVHHLWMFFAAYLIIAVGSSLCGFLTANIILMNWFVKKRTRAASIALAGLSFGGVGGPLLVWSLTTFGWRATAMGSAGLVVLIGLPITQIVRANPEQYGLQPDGDGERVAKGDGSPGVPSAALQGFTTKEALRLRSFWLLAVGHGLALLAVSAVNVHLYSHLRDRFELFRNNDVAAATIVTIFTVMVLVFQIAGGFLGDKFNKRVILVLCMLGHGLGMAALAIGTNLFMVGAFVLLHSLAWGVRGPIMTSIRADYFGRRSLPTVMGFNSMFATFGGVIAPFFAGWMFDLTGSYEFAFIAIAVACGLGAFAFGFASKPEMRTSPTPVVAGSKD